MRLAICWAFSELFLPVLLKEHGALANDGLAEGGEVGFPRLNSSLHFRVLSKRGRAKSISLLYKVYIQTKDSEIFFKQLCSHKHERKTKL